jgi:hypothetical protein
MLVRKSFNVSHGIVFENIVGCNASTPSARVSA